MSKETAVIYPGLLILLGWYDPQLRIFLGRHWAILIVYLVFRFGYFGFAAGDSYVWQISPSVLNTLIWYGLWSFNLPEMWVDFVGPGLKLNPNLLRYWGQPTVIIFSLFLTLAVSTGVIFVKTKINRRLLLFCVTWFVICLGPLLLLPWHKFTFYLTLPLVGLVIFLAGMLIKSSPITQKIFLISWILLSVSTYSLTVRTNWISRGAETAVRFHTFFQASRTALSGKTLVFYDTPVDASLPWSPTGVVKDVLSNNNYFRVFSPSTQAVYSGARPGKIDSHEIPLISRQFLGY
jgi:hypothetical protein